MTMPPLQKNIDNPATHHPRPNHWNRYNKHKKEKKDKGDKKKYAYRGQNGR